MIGEPANFDESRCNKEMLQKFIIKQDCIMLFIMVHEQLPLLYVKMVNEKPLMEPDND